MQGVESINGSSTITLSSKSSTEEEDNREYALFVNQVGGHCTLLAPRHTNSYVIKPTNIRELEFYQQMQQWKEERKLLEFLPQFYGTTEVTASTKIFIQEALQKDQDTSEDEKISWLKQLFKEKSFQGRYIKLQNVTKKFKFPCILDIKMGFTAPSLKHKDKFDNSTNHTHGFRICGMNIYWPEMKKTVFKDKYWGRQVNDETLANSLAFYFYNGEELRKDIIAIFIEKLNKLKEALETYQGFIFKSSSLLLIYEGAIEEQVPSTTLKLIDFANIQIRENSNRMDSELIDGISNLLTFFKQILLYQSDKLQLIQI